MGNVRIMIQMEGEMERNFILDLKKHVSIDDVEIAVKNRTGFKALEAASKLSERIVEVSDDFVPYAEDLSQKVVLNLS